MPTPNPEPAVRFALNGRVLTLAGRDALRPLSELLRERLGLTGTKVVCAEGDCGACTVLVGRAVEGDVEIHFEYRAVDACILFAFQCHGTHVVTVEGLGCATPAQSTATTHPLQTNDQPAPADAMPLTVIQRALVDGHGSQCGFCTPGIVMALHALRERPPEAAPDASKTAAPAWDHQQLRHGLSGNLCRCTGYQQIFDACAALDPDAITRLADAYDEPALLRELRQPAIRAQTLTIDVPRTRNLQDTADEPKSLAANNGRFLSTNGDVRPVGHTRPHPHPTLQHRDAAGRALAPAALPTRTVTLHLPATLDDALRVKHENPDALLVAGATDIGVWHNHGTPWPDHVLCLTALSELSACDETDDALVIGGGASWDTVATFVEPWFPDFRRVLDRFGSPQIRQLGTMAGNLANGSPIADSTPLLMAMDAEVELASHANGRRRIRVTDFYTGYKQNVLKPDELIVAICLPKPGPNDRLHLEKTTKRRDMDISTFTAAIRVTLDASGATIERAAVALGGVGPVVTRLPDAEAALAGQPFTEATLRDAGRAARDAIAPISDVRGSADYRHLLAENVFRKAWFAMRDQAPHESS